MPLTYDELEVGKRFSTEGRTLTESDLGLICQLSWNIEPLHNNVQWVKKHTSLRDRIFPGLFLMAVQSGLEQQLGLFREQVITLLGINNVKFLGPVFPGDTVYSTVEVVSKRESSKPDRGVVTVRATIINQDEQTCAEWERVYLYKRD